MTTVDASAPEGDSGLRKRSPPSGSAMKEGSASTSATGGLGNVGVPASVAVKIWEFAGIVLDALGPNLMKAKKLYDKLPHRLVLGMAGLALCFFGGRYALLIAAVEAFRAVGWPNVQRPLKELYQEFLKINDANKQDDLEDADADGIADVKQMDNKMLLARKVALALRTADPTKLSEGFTGLAAGFGAVIAVLQAEFAMTIALGNSVAKHLKRPISFVLDPILKLGIPRDYQRWVPVIINWVCKIIAVTVAWVVRATMSAVQSAIRGGMICSRALIDELVSRKIIPGVDKVDHDGTMIDELGGWGLATIGIWYQLSGFFGVPMLLYPLALPFDVAEGVLGYFVLKE